MISWLMIASFFIFGVWNMRITVVEAGRLGGLALLRNRGRAYFATIGKKGQRITRNRYPAMASQWGKLGGRPRKPKLSETMGERSK